MINCLLAKYPVQDDDKNEKTAREFYKDTVVLFDIMLDKADFYIASRGRTAFVSTIVSQSGSSNPMLAKDVENLVRCYVAARKAYSPPQGNHVANDLTELVDQWLEVEHECRSLPPPEVFRVAINTDTGGNFNESSQFQNPSQAFHQIIWPPAYFSRVGRDMMLNPRIRPLIEGRSIETPGGFLPLPTRTSMPSVVQAFLASIALENYKPRQPWRIGLPAMANFMRPVSKGNWAATTNGETNLMWSPSVFAQFSDTVFKDPGVHIAIGLLTP